MAPQAAAAAAVVLYVTDNGGRAAYRLYAKPAHTGLQTHSQRTTFAVLVCCLMVSTSVIHVISWVTTHLPTPKGWEAELACLVDP